MVKANIRVLITAALSVFAVATYSQPAAPTTPDAVCAEVPAATGFDTVQSAATKDGFYQLFNGTDFTGWWQSCKTTHSSSNTQLGGVFRVDPTLKAIYTTQRGSAGGILMTKKKYLNYELVFETWPDFGNDAGIFNRTTATGACFQTVMDYISGASVGGTWGEGSFTGRDNRPWTYGNDDKTINIGTGTDPNKNWTLFTKGLSPETYGCPATGCVAADYSRLWDVDGWNQFRIKFYGGVSGNTRIRMKSYFRKSTNGDALPWVPVEFDTTLLQTVAEGYVGLQVHGGGRFSGAKGTWYRNIFIRPLTAEGKPLAGAEEFMEYPKSGVSSAQNHLQANQLTNGFEVSLVGRKLSGTAASGHTIAVSDANGKVVANYEGQAGNFNYILPASAKGALYLSLKSKDGVQRLTLIAQDK